MRTLLSTLTGLAALGAGLAGGGFLVFSTFVLQGLDGLPAPGAVAAMQQINRRAVTPLFMLVIFGTALLAVALVVLAVRGHGGTTANRAAVAGAVLFLVGAVLVTVIGNVPLNDRLARLDAAAAAPADWEAFRSRWLLLNHVRTAASAAACGLLLVGFRAWP